MGEGRQGRREGQAVVIAMHIAEREEKHINRHFHH